MRNIDKAFKYAEENQLFPIRNRVVHSHYTTKTHDPKVVRWT